MPPPSLSRRCLVPCNWQSRFSREGSRSSSRTKRESANRGIPTIPSPRAKFSGR
uniref:Uncharacterized protein n=1 Tax=Arundo donax TaxID=35708 RepID=A0A0A8YPL0_ARUDO